MANKEKNGKSGDTDEVVLSYHDCLLRNSDVNLLKGQHWLNDVIIGFYFTYLERTISDTPQGQKIKFFSPELTQFIKLVKSVSEYSSMLDCVITQETEFIFFPLNDCQHYDDAGGTHWSLLIYSKVENEFFHFDSMNNYNHPIARNFADGIKKYLMSNNLIGKPNKTNNFHKVTCPQQDNCYDCGVFVTMYAELILHHINVNHKIDGCDLGNANDLVKTQRSKILQLISELKNSNS